MDSDLAKNEGQGHMHTTTLLPYFSSENYKVLLIFRDQCLSVYQLGAEETLYIHNRQMLIGVSTHRC